MVGPFLATRVAADANFDTVLPRDQQQESKRTSHSAICVGADILIYPLEHTRFKETETIAGFQHLSASFFTSPTLLGLTLNGRSG